MIKYYSLWFQIEFNFRDAIQYGCDKKNIMSYQNKILFVSVIIPVFNDARRLKKCLEALINQTYYRDYYEVIVVDNGSDEDIEKVTSKYKRVILAHEKQVGSYAARNKGILMSRGDVLAFTDADCIPKPNWIERGVAHLTQVNNCGLVAGKIEVFYKNPECPTPVELYDGLMFGYPQKTAIEKEKYGLTANIFTFKHVFDRVGFFNANLKSTGDCEWGQRVYLAGYQQVYGDDTIVNHPARDSFKQLYNRIIRIVGGRSDFNKIKSTQSCSVREFFREWLKLIRNFLPPRKGIYLILANEQVKGYREKINLILIFTLLKYASAWELMRLKLGGKSIRG